MTVRNPSKATIALVALICLTVLRFGDKIDQATFAGLAGLIIGYAVGNGIAAKQGLPVDPIIGNRE